MASESAGTGETGRRTAVESREGGVGSDGEQMEELRGGRG